jgi:hypothetical protein
VLDSDLTLYSAVSLDDLMASPLKNMIVVQLAAGDVFARFQACELLAARTWKLSGMIWDTVDFPRLNSIIGSGSNIKLAVYQGSPFTYAPPVSGQNLYFKIPSFNLVGVEQSLANCIELPKYVAGLVDKPLAPYNIGINGIGIDAGGSLATVAGDLEIVWMSRNRFGTGYNNFAQTDATPEDADFIDFQVEIYNGATLKRTVNQAGKSFTYTAAMQAADGAVSPFVLKVRQNGQQQSSGYAQATVTTV